MGQTASRSLGLASRAIAAVVVAASLFLAMFVLSQREYLFFHALIETFALLVAFGIFVIAWTTRRIVDNAYLLVLGIGSLFVGIVTMLHLFTYRGMGVFPLASANLATQLWIISRFLVAMAFLGAGLSLVRRPPVPAVFALFTVLTTTALAAVLVWPVFPTMYVDGVGLTPLKIAAEYLAIVLYGFALLQLVRSRDHFEPNVFRLLAGSVGALMAAELAFTLYMDVYGFLNFLGHCFWLLSLVLVYMALIDTGLRRPYSLLFRELAQREAVERSIAETLQRAIVSTPDRIASIEIGHQYLSATQGAWVGGDFFDLFGLPGCDLVGFFIGDVCGKGIEAAATTTAARVTLRGFAYEDPDPGRVLERASGSMRMQISADKFITVVFGVVDLATGRVRLAGAGHPGPVLRSGGQVRAIELPQDPPIGVLQSPRYEVVELQMRPGDDLVLFSDGLLDAGWATGAFGMDGIIGYVRDSVAATPAELAAGLLAAGVQHARGPITDDVAIVAFRYLPESRAG